MLAPPGWGNGANLAPGFIVRKLAVCLVMGFLVCWGGACAVHRPPPTVAPWEAEAPGCEVPELQRQLAFLEGQISRNSANKASYLVQAARLCFALGELSSKGEKQRYFETGRRFAQTLAAEQPAWAEGHYWLALNLCGLAELGGARRGLGMVPEIVAAMEKALKVNPAYDQAGPHRVLGRIYYECPPWPLSVGDLHLSRRHLSEAVALAVNNSTNHLYLGQTLLKMGRRIEARQELEKVLQVNGYTMCPQHLEEDRREARRLLQESR